jgi:hypothetical protein
MMSESGLNEDIVVVAVAPVLDFLAIVFGIGVGIIGRVELLNEERRERKSKNETEAFIDRRREVN